MPKAVSVARDRPLTGIALKVTSVAVFVAMASFIKASGPLPAGQMVFFRSLFAIAPILAMLAWRRQLSTAFATSRPFSHIARGTIGVCAMGLSFFALTRLPLPEAIILGYAKPLIVVVFSAIFLGEIIRIFRWSAVIVGLLGVVVVSWPKLTLTNAGLGQAETVGVLAALGSATLAAFAMLLVRKLVKTERTPTIVLWFSLTATVLSLFSLPFGWEPMSSQQVVFLVAAGFCGGLGQILLTESYRHAEISTIAPFEYVSMLLAVAVGYLAFSDIPTFETIVGGMIIMAAGIFIIFREHTLGLERAKARKAITPQG